MANSTIIATYLSEFIFCKKYNYNNIITEPGYLRWHTDLFKNFTKFKNSNYMINIPIFKSRLIFKFSIFNYYITNP